MTFLVQFKSTMGRKLDRGPSGYLGFCSAINVPLPRESNAVCCSNIMFVMLARGVKITLGAYFIRKLLCKPFTNGIRSVPIHLPSWV